MPMRLTNDVRVEKVGGEFVALDRSGAVVHRVTGEAAVVLGLVIDGADVPSQYDDALATLVDAGVVESHGMTRRHLLLAAGAAGAGITTFALAAPSAAASSGCPGTFKPTSGTQTHEGGAALVDFTFNTGKGATLITFEGWGGGGGGGGAKTSNPGGGGGGGAYAKVTVSNTHFAECTTYTIKVGSDGSGGKAGTADGNGGAGSDMKVSLRNALNTADVVKDAIKAKGGSGGSKSLGSGGAGGTGSSAAGTATLVRTNDGGAGAKAPDTSKGGGGGGGAGDAASATGGAASGATGGSGGSNPGTGAGGAGGASATNGSAGSAPGGGGGGGGSGSTTGGAGAAGRLKIYWS